VIGLGDEQNEFDFGLEVDCFCDFAQKEMENDAIQVLLMNSGILNQR
jgi:hypothetical protein